MCGHEKYTTKKSKIFTTKLVFSSRLNDTELSFGMTPNAELTAAKKEEQEHA